jgi:hypothetical protein
MSDIQLTEIPTVEVPHEEVYEAEKIELSKNILKFDKKPRVYTQNPYSFNAVSLRKKEVKLMPSAEQMLTDSTYNAVGRFLGVDTHREWNKNSDRVYEIVEWAKKKSGESDTMKIVRFINRYRNLVPSLAERHLDNLYLYAHQQLKKWVI